MKRRMGRKGDEKPKETIRKEGENNKAGEESIRKEKT